MHRAPDPRIDIANAMPMQEIVDRLPLEGLRREGRELVGPCPKCGGRDRFAVNPDRGVFNCRICQARGDGIELVRHVMGCDFLGALEHLCGERREVDPEELKRRRQAAAAAKAKREAEAERYRQWAIRDAQTIWRSSIAPEGTPVIDYLAHARRIRLPVLPKSIRFKPDHPYVRKLNKRLVTLHRGPCMIAAVQGPDDRLAAVHQTWIDLDREDGKAVIVDPESGEVFPSKMVRGSQKAGAIRLDGEASAGVLIMGEGIETTLSARLIRPDAAAYWAGVSLGNMGGPMLKIPGVKHSGEPDLDERAFVPPPWVKRLVFIQDGDSDPEFTRATLLSGIKRAQANNPALDGAIMVCPEGADLNDVLRGETE